MTADQATHASHNLERKGRRHACHFVWNCVGEKEPQEHPHEKWENRWYKDMRAKSVPLSGEGVQQKALCFARMLGYDDFRANLGWRVIFTSDF